jgi:hypothetical protein
VKNQQLFVPFAKRPGYGFMKYFYYTFCQGYMNYPPAAYVVTFALLYSYVFGKLARWKNRQLSLIGKSVIVSSQLLPAIMFTGSVMSMPASMNQELSRGIYRFIWNGNDKEKRALTYQKLKNGGLGLPGFKVHEHTGLLNYRESKDRG